jgi:hypothetical protein
MTYVYEFLAAAAALHRKITRVKVLHAKVRALLREMQVRFTISRQPASSLREGVEKLL